MLRRSYGGLCRRDEAICGEDVLLLQQRNVARSHTTHSEDVDARRDGLEDVGRSSLLRIAGHSADFVGSVGKCNDRTHASHRSSWITRVVMDLTRIESSWNSLRILNKGRDETGMKVGIRDAIDGNPYLQSCCGSQRSLDNCKLMPVPVTCPDP